MKIFLVFCLFLVFTTANTKNLPDTLYDSLVNDCPILNLTDTSFKNQEIFQKCKNWQEIKETKELKEETKMNVLCLLYYDSFMSFCNDVKLSQTKITNITVNLVPDSKEYQNDKVCKVIPFPASKKFEHDIDKFITDETICYKLCLNFDKTVVPECSLAHYFANYNISQLTQGTVTNPKQVEISSSETKPASLDKINERPKDSLPQQTPNIESSQKVNHTDNNGDKPVISQLNNSANAPIVNPKISTVNLTQENNISKPANAEPQPGSQSALPVDNADAPNSGTVKDESGKSKSPENDKLGKNKQGDTSVGEQQSNNEKGEVVLTTTEQPNFGADSPDDDSSNLNYIDPEQKPESDNVPINGNVEENLNMLTGGMPINDKSEEEMNGDSYFFSYFMVVCVLFVLGYVGYHNRQKVMALVLEGKRGRRQVRGRRPNSANYHKLDSNLEEAISSTCTKSSSHVIY